MNLRPSLLLMCLLLCGSAAAQQTARVSMHEVRTEGTRVVLTWQTELEPDVKAFEIHRNTPTSTDFVLLHTVNAHGPAKPYVYTDLNLYKGASSLAEYKVVAVYRSGVRQDLFSEKVNYTSTGIRRTWGSLKAMFQ